MSLEWFELHWKTTFWMNNKLLSILRVLLAFLPLTLTAQIDLRMEIDSFQTLIKVEENDSIRIRYLNYVGHRYRRLNDNSMAMEMYQKSLREALKINHKWGVADAYSNIHLIYYDQGMLEKAKESLNAALNIFAELGDSLQIAKCYHNMGLVLHDSEEYDAALAYMEKALAIKQQFTDTISTSNSMSGIADLYKAKGETQAALIRFKEVLKLRQSIHYVDGEIFSLMHIGGVYVNLKNYAEANRWIHQALDLALKTDRIRLAIQCYSGLSQFYAADKDFENAYKYQLLYHHVTDSINSAQNAAHLDELLVQYETEKKQRELVELGLQQEKDAAALAEASFWQSTLTMGILLIIGIAVLVVMLIMRRNRTQREKERRKVEKLAAELKLKALNALIQGQETERKRIAQELHDGLGGMLASLRIRMPAEQTQADEKQSLAKHVDEICTELRRIAHNMMPEVLLRFGLVAAIEDLAQKINSGGRLHVVVQQVGMEGAELGDEKFELPVYRIVQELLSNALKHANAREILVQFYKEEKRLSIVVEDDGDGFEVANMEGMGMKSLQSRVQYLNGTLTLDSQPQNGTSAIVELPLS